MPQWQRYLRPTSLEQALHALADSHPHARPIAGGTDLLIDLQQGRDSPPQTMVDVSGIAEMTQIEQQDDSIMIGASVTHRRIVDSPLLQHHARCLVEACDLIGGPQVRNVATLGGNVAHALPAGDGTIALLALGAEAELASLEGRRWQPLESLFAGPGEITFDRTRVLITGFRLPSRGPLEASAFSRVMRPQDIAIAILNLAVWLRLDRLQRVAACRLALGPSGPTPRRMRRAEAELQGRSLDRAALEDVVGFLVAEGRLRTSRYRATKAYREHLIDVLVKRVIPEAWKRAMRDPEPDKASNTIDRRQRNHAAK